jgi:hypothetical protein
MNASRLQPLPTSRHPHWIDPNVLRGDMSEAGEVSKDWLASAEPQTQDKKDRRVHPNGGARTLERTWLWNI